MIQWEGNVLIDPLGLETVPGSARESEAVKYEEVGVSAELFEETLR